MPNDIQPPGDSPVRSSDLLGAVVEVSMIGWDGKWLVVEDSGGARVFVQRPQDFRRRWVMRRYVKAPNDKLSD
jgi:hypothetical protein